MDNITTMALHTKFRVSVPMTYNSTDPDQGGSASLEDMAISGRDHQGSIFVFPSALMKSLLVTYTLRGAAATWSCSWNHSAEST